MKSRLTAVIVIGLVVLQLLTIGVVVAVTSLTASESLTAHVSGVLRSATAATGELANEYFAGAEQALTRTAGLAAQELVDLSNPEAAERYLLEQVAADSHIDGMYWAGHDGAFVYIARSDERAAGGYRTKVITFDGPDRTTTLTWRDAGLEFVDQFEDETDTYDPLIRPWFTSAITADGVVWTDPYIFYTARRPGITAALEIRGGSSVGVIGTDIRLAALSTFLAAQTVSEGASAFIVTSTGNIIAHSDPELLVATDPTSGSLEVANVSAVADPGAVAATDTGLTDGVGSFIVDDADFVVARELLVAGWEVVVAAPEADFLGELRAAQRTGLYLVVAVALIAFTISIPLVIWAMRPTEEHADGSTAPRGLPDRQTFHQDALPAFQAAQQENQPISAVMVDLDHFKRTNETYGHLTADEIVRAVGGRMKGALSAGDLIARFGGDEFAVLLPRVDIVTAKTIASRLRRAVVDAPIKTSHGPVYTTISVGVASTEDQEATLEGLIHDADGAMYRAKRAGRDRIEVASNKTIPVRRTTNN